MYMFSSNLLRTSHCRCFEIVRPLGRGTLPQSCRLVVPVLSNSCAEVVPRVFICPKPVLKLSQRCPNVVPKLSPSCLKVSSKLSQSYLKGPKSQSYPKLVSKWFQYVDNLGVWRNDNIKVFSKYNDKMLQSFPNMWAKVGVWRKDNF